MQDVLGSIEIGVHNDTTGFAFENCTSSLPSPKTSTGRASFGCVSCGNELNCNSELLSFIDEELLQLSKCPVGKEPVLFVPMFCASNSLKIFQDDYSLFSYTFNQFPTDAMVDVSHKTVFSSTHLNKMPLCGTSAFASQPAAQTNITLLNFPDMLAIIEQSIRSCYQIVYSPINSDYFSSLVGFVGEFLYGNHQPEFPILASYKIAFLYLPSDKLPEVFGNFNSEFDTSLSCEKANNFLFKVNSTTPCIIVNRLARKNRLLPFSFNCSLNRSTGIFIGDNRQLRWQTKVLPKFCISFVMNSECVGVFNAITGVNDEVFGRCHLTESIIKNRYLSAFFQDNRLHSFYHNNIKDCRTFINKIREGSVPGRILGLLKGCGIKTKLSQFRYLIHSVVSLRGIYYDRK